MAAYNFKNNLKASLYDKFWYDNTSISCNHLVTSDDADTRRNAWPAFPFTLTVVNTVTDAVEIVKCTALAANYQNFISFTCDRAQENTVAATFEIATTSVEQRLTADALNTVTSTISTLSSEVSAIATTAIGSIITIFATDTYVPNGCVSANGGEYTRTQLASFYDDYLVAGKLITCTYSEFAAQLALTGNCAKFALDTTNQKFKVPLLKDGDSITQAASAANAIYGNSTTVTDEQIRLRHFVVVASAQNSASVFDWSNYMAGLAGKANTDLSNATTLPQGILATALNASGSAPMYACRAWVNFDGTTTPLTIRASGNISSIVHLGTGYYEINFTIPMQDTNYVVIGTCCMDDSQSGYILSAPVGGVKTVSKINVRTDSTNNHVDAKHVSVAIFC